MPRPTLNSAIQLPRAARWFFAGVVAASGVAISEVHAQSGRGNGYVQQRFDRERFQLKRFQEDARSITQPRPLMPDERRKPRSYQRQTHRGYEVRTNNYEIVAPTKQQAEAAAQEFAKGWTTTLQLANRVGRDTGGYGFTQRSVVVFVDGEQKALPRSNREFANQSQYVVQLRSGEDKELHAHELRAAAARSFLSASEWDRELPPWFVLGVSEWVSSQFDETPRSFSAEAANAGETLVGTNGPFRSTRQVFPASPAPRHDDAATVSYLLQENGGRNAWLVLDALRDRGQAKERLNLLRSDSRAAFDPESLLKAEPQVQFSEAAANSAAILAAEQDLYVLLRLAERERQRGYQSSLTSNGGMRVLEFQNGQTQEQDVRINKGLVENQPVSAQPSMLMRRLRSKLSENNWSVFSPSGDWIDRTNSYTIAQRLDSEMTIEFVEDRWLVTYPLPDASGRQLTAVWRNPTAPGSAIQFEPPETLEAEESQALIVTPPNGS